MTVMRGPETPEETMQQDTPTAEIAEGARSITRGRRRPRHPVTAPLGASGA